MNVRSFILVATAALAVGVLQYINPAAGLAVLGTVTALAALTQLVRR